MSVRARVTRETLRDLADWADGVRWEDLPRAVRDAQLLVLENSLDVMLTGARSSEHEALARSVTVPGPAPVYAVGRARTSAVDQASWLNSLSLVRYELDEGHKDAAGHPAAHSLPAVLAAASEERPSGPRLLTALVVGYEVAARFGRATSAPQGTHPHGTWGMAGSGAAIGVLLGLSPDRLAAAIDTAAGMAHVAPFNAALTGNPVRDLWIASSNQTGLWAGRLARAGVARATGATDDTLGARGSGWQPETVVDGLATEWMLGGGYLKRHAACAFTHPAADAALALVGRVDPDIIDRIEVHTTSLSAPLSGTAGSSRLEAMFSIPVVVAAVLVHGQIGPREVEAVVAGDSTVAGLARRIQVVAADEFDRNLPQRGARVTLRTRSGDHEAAVEAPVGDADYHPLDRDAMRALATENLGARAPALVAAAVDALPSSPDAATTLEELASTLAEENR